MTGFSAEYKKLSAEDKVTVRKWVLGNAVAIVSLTIMLALLFGALNPLIKSLNQEQVVDVSSIP